MFFSKKKHKCFFRIASLFQARNVHEGPLCALQSRLPGGGGLVQAAGGEHGPQQEQPAARHSGGDLLPGGGRQARPLHPAAGE